MMEHYSDKDIKISYDNTRDTANISLYSDVDGRKQNMNFAVNKDDLIRELNKQKQFAFDDADFDSLLNIDSVQKPLDERLIEDFGAMGSNSRSVPVYYVELPVSSSSSTSRSRLPPNIGQMFLRPKKPVDNTLTEEELIINIDHSE